MLKSPYTMLVPVKKTNNSTLIRKYSDSMAIGIEKAEKWYNEAMASYKPYLENLKKTIVEKKIKSFRTSSENCRQPFGNLRFFYKYQLAGSGKGKNGQTRLYHACAVRQREKSF